MQKITHSIMLFVQFGKLFQAFCQKFIATATVIYIQNNKVLVSTPYVYKQT